MEAVETVITFVRPSPRMVLSEISRVAKWWRMCAAALLSERMQCSPERVSLCHLTTTTAPVSESGHYGSSLYDAWEATRLEGLPNSHA